MKKHLLITLLILSAEFCIAQTFPKQHFTGTVGSFTRTLIDTAGNESNQLNSLIVEVSNNSGGGTIIIPTGNYELGNIYLLSNVHIAIDKDVVITLGVGTKGVFFVGNSDDINDTISNVKIFCSNCDLNAEPFDDERYYTVDYRYVGPDGRGKVATIKNVENFHISDYKVLENHSKISTLNITPAYTGTFPKEAPQNSTFRAVFVPKKGNIENLCVVNAAGGYGVVQVQCAVDVSFKDLYGIGGSTLRLESGAAPTNIGTLIDTDIAVMKGIQAQNINCINGSAALMMSPHGRIHEDVEIRDVYATGTAFAVRISKGFIDGEVKVPFDAPNSQKENADPSRYKKGVFKSVKIHNVTAIYKENTSQIGFVDWTAYPSAIKGTGKYDDFKIGPFGGIEAPSSAKSRINVPSIAPILYASIDNKDDSPTTVTGINDPRYAGDSEGDGKFEVEFTGTITATGFLPCFEAKNYMVHNDDKSQDYCSSSLSTNDDLKFEYLNVYLNNTTHFLHVNTTSKSDIVIYNITGTIVNTYNAITDNSKINLNYLSSGLYIVKANNFNNDVLVKKIVVK